jgi:hypothetical protein
MWEEENWAAPAVDGRAVATFSEASSACRYVVEEVASGAVAVEEKEEKAGSVADVVLGAAVVSGEVVLSTAVASAQEGMDMQE